MKKKNLLTVDDEISDFVADSNILNVAISRAKKELIFIVTGNNIKNQNIKDFIDYTKYINMEVEESDIYSVFDILYKQYEKERLDYFKKHKKISNYDSENIMYHLLNKILEDYKDIFDTLAGDTSFEGRLCSFKIKDGREEEFVYLFNKYFSNYFVLMTKEELIDSKLLGNGTEHKYFRDSLGDYFALAYSNKYFKYRNVGHIHKSTHAGLTEDEMKIPLIVLNKCKVKRK